ncbi:hypothetical protein HOM50_00880 [bacterium]|jgi:hypothetical protein|nr:hypothetical protein [bacterium]MBT5014944.1 hypothetical protein [bacterium]
MKKLLLVVLMMGAVGSMQAKYGYDTAAAVGTHLKSNPIKYTVGVAAVVALYAYRGALMGMITKQMEQFKFRSPQEEEAK